MVKSENNEQTTTTKGDLAQEKHEKREKNEQEKN
jgi:hypothetical protein